MLGCTYSIYMCAQRTLACHADCTVNRVWLGPPCLQSVWHIQNVTMLLSNLNILYRCHSQSCMISWRVMQGHSRLTSQYLMCHISRWGCSHVQFSKPHIAVLSMAVSWCLHTCDVCTHLFVIRYVCMVSICLQFQHFKHAFIYTPSWMIGLHAYT